MDTFEIGLTLDNYSPAPLEEIFFPHGDAFDPDWSFQDFAASVDVNDGMLLGQGYPIAIWRFNHISETNRAVIRAFCPNKLSARVYITTKTNEIDEYGDPVFSTFYAVMKWTDTDEDKAADQSLGLVITFTHLILQA